MIASKSFSLLMIASASSKVFLITVSSMSVLNHFDRRWKRAGTRCFVVPMSTIYYTSPWMMMSIAFHDSSPEK